MASSKTTLEPLCNLLDLLQDHAPAGATPPSVRVQITKVSRDITRSPKPPEPMMTALLVPRTSHLATRLEPQGGCNKVGRRVGVTGWVVSRGCGCVGRPNQHVTKWHPIAPPTSLMMQSNANHHRRAVVLQFPRRSAWRVKYAPGSTCVGVADVRPAEDARGCLSG